MKYSTEENLKFRNEKYPNGLKPCSKCKFLKSFDNFSYCSKVMSGLRSQCQTCERTQNSEWRAKPGMVDYRRKYRIEKEYNIKYEDFLKMSEQQEHKCLICETTDSKARNGEFLVIDHCHETSKIRGLLCNDCNTALGKFKDDIKLLLKAIEYLKR